MANFFGTPARAAQRRPLGMLVLALFLAGCLSGGLAVPAGAQVVSIGPVAVGLQGRVDEETLETSTAQAETYANPQGNPVLHGESTYAIYWDPTDHYHGDWQAGIDKFLQGVGASSGSLASVFAIDAQYQDKSNAPASYADVYKGSYTDTTPYPANGCVDPHPFEAADRIGPGKTAVCLTSTQMAAQLEAFITAHAFPRGMKNVYYLLTPPGVTVCLDAGGSGGHCSDYEGKFEEAGYRQSFCSYHADINPGGLPSGDANTILYGVIPWSAGGIGDPHLTFADRTKGWECQDGGFDPSSKPVEEHEEFPHAQEPNQLRCPTSDGGCDTGLFDLITTQVANEQQNIVTDPLLNGWQDSTKRENTDECRFFFAPAGGSPAVNAETGAGSLLDQEYAGGSYYLNDAFNLAALKLPYPGVPCLVGANLVPQFTAPNTVNTGETVAFDGMESNITLNAATTYPGGAPSPTYATYSWNFGDGTGQTGYAPGAVSCEAPWLSPCAASVFHNYSFGGIYPVTLTVTDVAGNVSAVTHNVTVDGPAPPGGGGSTPGTGGPSTPSGGASTSTGSGGATGSGSGSGNGTGPGRTAGVPSAKAAVASHSLRTALRRGLAVSYSVNEQVAGRFEVLIARSLAGKLKISGTPASGLPAGTPPQLVIAKALLITTKGGASTIHIMFSKKVAARLKHAHRAALMLRLIVRNGASTNPLTATVLSSVTLAG